MFCKKGVLLTPATLLKRRLRFPVADFAKFSKAPILRNTSGHLLLDVSNKDSRLAITLLIKQKSFDGIDMSLNTICCSLFVTYLECQYNLENLEK